MKKKKGEISLFPWKQAHKQISLYHKYLLHPFCRKWTVVPQSEISYLFFTLDKENHHWCIPSLFSFTFYKIPSSLSGYLVGGQLHPYKSQWLDKDTYSHPSKDHIVPLAARARHSTRNLAILFMSTLKEGKHCYGRLLKPLYQAQPC